MPRSLGEITILAEIGKGDLPRNSDMFDCSIVGGLPIPLANRGFDPTHFQWRYVATVGGGNSHCTQVIDASIERFDNFPGNGLASLRKEDVVEAGCGVEYGWRVTVVEGVFDPVDRISEPVGRTGTRSFGACAGGHSLEHTAHFVDLFDHLWVEASNDRSLVRNGLNQSLGFEVAQDFAHHTAADAEAFAQITFDEAIARSEAEAENGFAHLLESEFTQGCGLSIDSQSHVAGIRSVEALIAVVSVGVSHGS